MTIRNFLVAGILSLSLTAPVHAGVLGIGGGGSADVGLGDGSANAAIGLGARTKAGAGGANANAGASADVNAGVGAPDIPRKARSAAARGDARAEAAASSANMMAIRASEQLLSLGYSNVRLAGGLDAKAGSDLKFDAVNPKGKDVVVTMNSQTRAIVDEQSKL